MLKRKTRKKVLIMLSLLLLAGLVGFRGFRAWKSMAGPVDCAQWLKNLQYVPASTDPFQSLDLYLPRKPQSELAPLVVWIHGGAWVGGDKNYAPAQFLLSRGYAVASLNYRLADKHPHPAQIFDCKAAIRFLRAHAREYKLDPERFGVWGQSAGGHLVALLGTSGDIKELEGNLGNNNYSSRVQAVADWCGPTDLLSIASQAPPNCRIDFKSPTNPVAVLMGANKSTEACLSASPIKYVRKDNPPFLILHAEDDDIVPVGQSKELGRALKEVAVPVLCHIAPEGGHGLGKKEFIDETVDFFDKYLKK
jgi:acetyl esterase/lipase